MSVWYRSHRTSRSPLYTDRPCCLWLSTPSPPLGSHSKSCCSTDTWAGSSTTRWSGLLCTARTWWARWLYSARPCACRLDTWHKWGSPWWTGLGGYRWGRVPHSKHRRGQRRRAGASPVRETEERAVIRPTVLCFTFTITTTTLLLRLLLLLQLIG